MEEMNEEIIQRHNEVVVAEDITIHCGDFAWTRDIRSVQNLLKKLNGKHIFLRGSHDKYLKGTHTHEIFEITIEGQFIVCCHYCLRTWPRSHYNSWHVYGHSHGRLEPIGKSWDVGVDNNDFYPISFEQLKEIMDKRPDNPNLIRK